VSGEVNWALSGGSGGDNKRDDEKHASNHTRIHTIK